ncbi:MAG: hypothetical protein EOP56_15295 [Sphingobacteriales bacterium]|nr:MAG: hypothetical protein EOP56_15295 [Sphingobacteriales bacterium]
MSKTSRPAFSRNDLFRRLNAPYRVVFIDDESLEEVASYRLTMRQLYIVMSTGLVVSLLVIVTLLLLTPLKYYIPGYGNDKARMQVIKLKQNVDSLSDLVAAQNAYEENIRKVITGETPVKRDTAMLDVKQVRKEAMNSLLPMPEIKKDVIQTIKQENRKAKKNKKQNGQS